MILFDDYGLNDYPEARQIIDDFLKDKKGVLLKLPTAALSSWHLKPLLMIIGDMRVYKGSRTS